MMSLFVIGFCLCCSYESVVFFYGRHFRCQSKSDVCAFLRCFSHTFLCWCSSLQRVCLLSHSRLPPFWPHLEIVSEEEHSLLCELVVARCSTGPRATPTSNSSPTVEEFAADASNVPPFKISRVHNTDLLKTWRGKSLFDVQGCSTTFVTVVGIHNHFQDVFKEASLRDELALKPSLLPNALSRSLFPDRIRIFSFQV